MKSVLIAALVLVAVSVGTITHVAKAQPPTLWMRTYGGSGPEDGYDMQQTVDGGFIIVGSRLPGILLIKTDPLGNSVWTRDYGYGYGHSVRQTQDGGYIMTGSTSEGEGSDVILIKTNALGDTLWTQHYGGSFEDVGRCVQPTLDGGYIISGYTNSFGAGSYDFYLIKTDALGDTEWTRTYGGANYEVCLSGQETLEEGYILAGCTDSFGAGEYDVYLVKTDALGATMWTRTYGGSGLDQSRWVQQTQDGGYVVVGRSESFGFGNMDVILVKTDAAGNAVWTRMYGGRSNDDGYFVQQTLDGGYFITGETYSFAVGWADIYVIKTNAVGEMFWYLTFGGTQWEESFAGQQTLDGGYVIVGFTTSFGAGSHDVYLVRLGAESIPNITMTITPLSPPIIIPANGGSFQFQVEVENSGPTQQAFTVWAKIRYPDGSYTGPVIGPVSINPPVGLNIQRLRQQNIPEGWPAGDYYEIAYAAPNYLSTAYYDTSFLTFTKSPLSEGGSITYDASCTGEPFLGEDISADEFPPLLRGDRGDLVVVSPNPFNPTTALSFQLQAAGLVSLKVYDTAGRLVNTLVDGWREAGSYKTTFDGSKLAAGVYLVRLEAGNEVQVEKVVLLK